MLNLVVLTRYVEARILRYYFKRQISSLIIPSSQGRKWYHLSRRREQDLRLSRRQEKNFATTSNHEIPVIEHDQHPIPYPYTQVPLRKPDSIRLPELYPGAWNDSIVLSLKIGDVQTDAFEAISYCWDDPYAKSLLEAAGLPNASSSGVARCPAMCIVECDGHSIRVKPNLFMALRRLRKGSESRLLWVDAICLNQEDNDEKSERVPQMRSIYANAQRTIVWLGEEDVWTRASYETIRRWADIYRQSQDVYQPDLLLTLKETEGHTYEDEQLSFEALIRRSWFTRAWTFQEVVLSPDVELRCGASSVPWGDFSDACAAVIGAGQDRFVFEENSNIRTLHDFTNLQAKISSVESRLFDERFQLSRLLQRTRLQLATNPRDKLFSLLGIANPAVIDKNSYKPDYNRSVKDVFCQFTRAMIKEDGDLGVLSLIQRPSFGDGDVEKSRTEYTNAIHNLPSWVPAFHYQYPIDYIVQDTRIRQNRTGLKRTYLPQPIAQQYTEGWPRYWLNKDKSYNVHSGDITFETPLPDSLGVYGFRVGTVTEIKPIRLAGDPTLRLPTPTKDEVEQNVRKVFETDYLAPDRLKEMLEHHSGPTARVLAEFLWDKFESFLSFMEDNIPVHENLYPHTKEPIQIALVKTLTADMLPISPRLPGIYKCTYFPFHYDWYFWNANIHTPFYGEDKPLLRMPTNFDNARMILRLVISTIKVWVHRKFRQKGSAKSWHAFDTDELKDPVRIRALYQRLLVGFDNTTDEKTRSTPSPMRRRAQGWLNLVTSTTPVIAYLHFHPDYSTPLVFGGIGLTIFCTSALYVGAHQARSRWARRSERDPSVPAGLATVARFAARNELWGIVCELQRAIDYASWNRVFFVTDKGHIGIGPVGMRPGDEVFSLLGGHVPHVLRRVGVEDTEGDADGQATFTFLGESYVHGVMNGELWPDPDVSTDLEKMKARCIRVTLV